MACKVCGEKSQRNQDVRNSKILRKILIADGILQKKEKGTGREILNEKNENLILQCWRKGSEGGG